MTLSGYGYVCSAGETFDSVAREIWGDERYAADLLCANPEYAHQTIFYGNEMLYIPNIELPEDDSDGMEAEPIKAPWKE